MDTQSFSKETQELIENTQRIIIENKSEWENRYANYAKEILNNKSNIVSNREVFIETLRGTFGEVKTLNFYISTTIAKDYKTILYLDVRYRGQSIATLKVKNKKITISTKDKDANNKKHFNCNISLTHDNCDLNKIKQFIKFFEDRPNNRSNHSKSNEEHNIESLLLTEFSKKHSEDKGVKDIQPVSLFDIRYAMPTPLMASKVNTVEYSTNSRGTIDILARTSRGSNSQLTIIEVKDENKKGEPPVVALQQAIKYTVFIRELLRSTCGENWYKLFGFGGEMPEKLKLRAVCAMPNNIIDKSFANTTYKIGNDSIECHYIYFDYNGEQLSDFSTSLAQ